MAITTSPEELEKIRQAIGQTMQDYVSSISRARAQLVSMSENEVLVGTEAEAMLGSLQESIKVLDANTKALVVLSQKLGINITDASAANAGTYSQKADDVVQGLKAKTAKR